MNGIDDDQRHVIGNAATQVVAVAHSATVEVIEVFAVIGEQHDDGVVGQPVVLEAPQHSRDGAVGRGHRPVIESADLRRVGRPHRRL